MLDEKSSGRPTASEIRSNVATVTTSVPGTAQTGACVRNVA
jgi:hypothetical protein